jgi:hypothetical protein
MQRVGLSLLLSGIVLGGLLPTVHAKCARRLIHIEGTVEGPIGPGDRIQVAIDPDPNADQERISIADGTFKATVLFDSTASAKSRRGRDDCSRVPKTVSLSVVREDRQLSVVRLNVATDFREDSRGDYHVRAPIVLHVD